MHVNMLVVHTNKDWYDNLCQSSQKRDLEEANWWSPSNEGISSIGCGELLLFKLSGSDNVIAGGGVYLHSAKDIPCSLAWESFEESNGASSAHELRMLVADCKRIKREDAVDFKIGCNILAEPFFFDKNDRFPVPESWSPNIGKKCYSTADTEGLSLWNQVCDRILRLPGYAEMELRGNPSEITPRLGQGGFRLRLTDAYGRRCVVTKERTLPVLEAAHIRPFSKGGSHHPSNGLLLRRDIHALFDRGYVTVLEEKSGLRFHVSKRIREEHGNGRDYYAMDGEPVLRPNNPSWRPDPKALAWHNERCFVA